MKFHNTVWVISAYTIQEALKNRVLWIVLAFAVIGIAGASFLGDFAIVETERTEVAALSSFYRLGAVFTMMVLVVTTMVREFNDKCLELYLSLPLSRAAYFFGKLGGFFVIGAAVAAVFALVLALYTASFTALAVWFASLACELMVIAAISFFCVMTFNQQAAVSIIVAFFFYLLCRVSDDIVLISNSATILETTATSYLDEMVDVLVYVLPSLGSFTRPEWLMYGVDAVGEVALVVFGQTLVYTFLLSGAALIDFSRKNI